MKPGVQQGAHDQQGDCQLGFHGGLLIQRVVEQFDPDAANFKIIDLIVDK